MLSDCRRPHFRNLSSTVPVDVVRVKSYVNCLFLKLCESKYNIITLNKIILQSTVSKTDTIGTGTICLS